MTSNGTILPPESVIPVSIVFALSVIGVFGNFNVAFAAWKLRRTSTCHWFIFGRAVLDILHQLGHFVTAFLVYSKIETFSQKVCFALEIVPFLAVIGTSIVTLAIGIDRFIGFHLPFIYNKLNVTFYISTVYILTAAYAFTFGTLFFLTTTNMDEDAVCMPGSVITLDYLFPYLYTTGAIYLLTIIQYVSIWIISCKRRNQIPGYLQIMKPITIIVCISLFGWFSNYIFEIIASQTKMDSMLATFWGGITINFAVAVDFWVYYIFNSDYRRIFQKQLCKLKKTNVSVTAVSVYVKNPSQIN